MTIDIKVPVLPESVADATIAKWHKAVGDSIKRDENLVDIETDKVVLEVPATEDGVLEAIIKAEGEIVTAQELIGKLQPGQAHAPTSAAATEVVREQIAEVNGNITAKAHENQTSSAASANPSTAEELSPAVRRLVSQHNLDLTQVTGTGKGGRIIKEDVENYIQNLGQAPTMPTAAKTAEIPQPVAGRMDKRVPMTRLRARIAERLLGAKNNMALLTTFNEVNMQAVMDLRSEFKTKFEKEHQVRLGFMSFFVKAVVHALKKFPDVNALIDGNEIVYHGYYDIGVAVSTERGLVVPIVRDADQLSMAQIEKQIGDYALRARDGKITMEEMQGGTFSITNGGVFGSLLATPIVNPPQSAILGMHKIQERPVAENGQVVIRPMMYVALTYDHRIIDGKDSVGFLKTVKEMLERPSRILLDV